jgi:hypothetical protein
MVGTLLQFVLQYAEAGVDVALQNRAIRRLPVLSFVFYPQGLELRSEETKEFDHRDVNVNGRKLRLHELLKVQVAIKLEAQRVAVLMRVDRDPAGGTSVVPVLFVPYPAERHLNFCDGLGSPTPLSGKRTGVRQRAIEGRAPSKTTLEMDGHSHV